MSNYYLAYGSNLNMEQMEWRCPGAVVIGETFVEGYEMTFRSHSARGGVANIEPKKGSKVRALVWEITPEDEKALDRYEGFPWLYTKESMKVKVEGQELQTMVYIMTPGFPKAMPSASYMDTIEQGYRDCGWNPAEFAEWVKPYDNISYKGFSIEVLREQIIKVRDTGKTNMFHLPAVQRIAFKMSLFDLVDFIDLHPRAYSKFILKGRFE